MHTTIGSHIDLAQIVLYAFIAFFLGLVYYLHRENKREGYPLDTDGRGRGPVEGFPRVPEPKTYLLADGTTVQAPRAQPMDTRPINATALASFPGAPLVPNWWPGPINN